VIRTLLASVGPEDATDRSIWAAASTDFHGRIDQPKNGKG
jgi:hypothetical protein